jgi:hypothetical protein
LKKLKKHVIASALYSDVQVPRQAAAGSGQRGNVMLWNQSFGDCLENGAKGYCPDGTINAILLLMDGCRNSASNPFEPHPDSV